MTYRVFKQEYWSGLPFSPPGYLLNPGIEPTSPALAGRFFTPQPPGKSTFHIQAEKCQNDKETFTFLTFQKVRLEPKPISRSRPNKKWRETLVHLSVKFNCSVVSNSLWPHGLQHTGLPCPSPTPGACSNSHPSSQWCHPTMSPSPPAFNLSQHQGLP